MEHVVDAGAIRHVAVVRRCAAAGLPDRPCGTLGRRTVEIERRDERAPRRKELRNRRADALARTVHNGDLLLQIEHLTARHYFILSSHCQSSCETFRLLYR
jgi:hypothetical protein